MSLDIKVVEKFPIRNKPGKFDIYLDGKIREVSGPKDEIRTLSYSIRNAAYRQKMKLKTKFYKNESGEVTYTFQAIKREGTK